VGTAEAIDVVIDVRERVALNPRPPRIFLPVGSRVPVRIDGGSGAFDVVFAGDAVAIEDQIIEGRAVGRADLQVTDHFLGLQTQIRVDVVASLTADIAPFDDSSVSTAMKNPGDLNGDGIDDLLVGIAEADVAAGNGGAVYVFHSGPEGMGPEPVQVLAGLGRLDEYGRSLAVGDLNGDGQTDLVVGARLADIGTTDTGAAYVHLGQPDGTFAEEPAWVLGGTFNSDHLGWSMAVCDFNGDGRLDIAAGAFLHEDREVNPRANDQGGVSIFLGYEDGFLERPDQIVRGVHLENGLWTGDTGQRLATDLAAGDIDGDGYCDLAASTLNFRDETRDMPNVGAVFIFRGRAPDMLGPGGVTDLPVKAIVNDVEADNQGQFGRKIAMGDVNGDGLADLIVGQHVGDQGGSNAGSVHLYLGGPLPDGPAAMYTSAGTQDWIAMGTANDSFGIAVAVGDATGDGLDDIIIGAWTEDFAGKGDAGGVFAWAGVQDGVPAVDPTRVWEGRATSDLLGEAVEVIGDVTGDGLPDAVGQAAREDSNGRDLGRTYILRSEPPPPPPDPEGEPVEAPPQLLELTVVDEIGNGWYGRAIALLGDVDGDGHEDAAVAAPFVAEQSAAGMRSGLAWLYRGDGDGIERQPAATVGAFLGHTGFDLLGYAVTPAGDFDGDGRPDWALLIRDDERPGNFNNPGYAPVEGECPPPRNNSGGVYVFRGRSDGTLAAAPSFVFFPDEANISPEALAGGADFDGDGYDDLILGSLRSDPSNPDGNGNLNDAGAVWIIGGRPADPDDRQTVICEPIWKQEGTEVGANLGWAVTAVGDIDGDDCDEMAWSARLEDGADIRNQGVVYVAFGAGAPGCRPGPRVIKLTAGEIDAQLGWSLAAGDADGDGIPDLAAGALIHRRDNQSVGGAWVVPGSYLRGLSPTPLVRNLPGNGEAINPQGTTWLAEGTTVNERAGSAVALLPGRVAVSATLSDFTGVPLVGLVRVHDVTPSGVNPEPSAVLVGETWRPEGRVGEYMASGTVDGNPALIVGGYQGQGTGLDNGSAYVITLDE
ncbi:MAG: FG-GAP repeat protein, partial [Myxococcales bacterium]|nr:FG-GAP repeat protein [Myxococcales bacterium]